MSKENKFMRGIVIGALIGAAASLLDKQTRDDVMQCGKKATSKVKEYAKNPSDLTNDVKQTFTHMTDSVKELSDDITFVNERVKELKEATPQIVTMLQETKEHFTKNN
ncbi:YtxH domain-containing protein [Metabacillus sp. HB246100]|uniref:YtxH domain-containing protein n=1 Tax=Bacillus weihaiensis TaxID=1547283 RepID=UPI002356A3AD|nr:YtxH domain-containing protein [Bacillus weihaiensis]